jgi:hypothetical protein
MYHLYFLYISGRCTHDGIADKTRAITKARYYRDTLGEKDVRLTRKSVSMGEWQRATRREMGLNSGGHTAYVPFNTPERGSC